MASNDVVVRLTADISNLQRGLSDAQHRLTDLERTTEESASQYESAFKKIGLAITGAFAVDKMHEFGMSALESASQVSAMQSQYSQVLGNMKSDSDKYLDGISQKYNSNVNDLKGTFLQYYALLKGKGVKEGEAYNLSKEYLERTLDAAAFNNGSMAENTERFMAMIKGEYDSVDTAMVNLSQTMLNNTAIKEYGKKWDSLSVDQQEALKMQIAIKQHMSSGVMGQGIREASSYEVNMKNLNGAWRDFLATIGTPIIQTLAPQLQALSNSLKTADIQNFAKSIGNMAAAIVGALPSIASFTANILPLIAGVTAGALAFNILSKAMVIVGAVQEMTVVFREATGVMAGFNAVMDANPIGLISLAIGSLILVGVALYKNWDVIKAKASELWAWLSNVFTGIGTSITGVWNGITTYLTGVWNGIVNGCKAAFNGLVTFFSGIFTSIGSVVSAGWQTIKNIFTVALMFIVELVKDYLKLIALPFTFIWENIKVPVTSFFSWLKSIFTSGLSAAKSIWTNAWNSIVNVARAIMSPLISFFTSIFNSIKAAISSATNSIKSVTSSAWNSVRSVSSSVWNSIKSVISSVVNSIKAVVSSVFHAIASVVSSIWNSIRGVTSSIWNGIRSTISGIVNGIKSSVSSSFQGILGIASSVWNSIKGAITRPIEAAKNTVISMVDRIKSAFHFSWSLPPLKLPHFSMSGSFSLNPPSVPHFGISWYKTGGIFTGSSVIGVGEAGTEAVVPLSDKSRMLPFATAITDMMKSRETASAGNTVNNFNISSVVVREDADIQRIAEQLYKMQQRNNRKAGIV